MEEKQQKEKKPIYNKAWFWVIIVIVILGVIGGAFSDDNNTTTSTSANITNIENQEQKNEEQKTEEKQEPTESKKEYKEKCKTYSYKKIARNPNKYIGKRMKFKGKVIQVQEGWFKSVTLRVNVTKGEYGFWDDTIWVDYTYKDDNESKILDDDIITIYGEFKGTESYTSVLGSKVTIPKIEAKYININK